MHVLNLLWQPLLDYTESIILEEPGSWDSCLEKHQAIVTLEMQGVIEQVEETLPMDDWLKFVQQTLQRLVDAWVRVEF